jgi:hypothetical protein
MTQEDKHKSAILKFEMKGGEEG